MLFRSTCSLDPATEAAVVAGYEALMRGRTTVLITHRLELARRADRVIVLDRGRIIESGAPAQLLAARGGFSDIFDVASPPVAVAG